MAGKFEWQFKYRDEADVNAPARRPRGDFKKSLIRRHFCDSSDSVYRGIWDIDNHRALWRASCGIDPRRRHKRPGRAKLRQTCSSGTPRLRRRRQAGDPGFQRGYGVRMAPGRRRATTPGLEKRARKSSAPSIRAPSPAPGCAAVAVRSPRVSDQQCREMGMPAIPRPQENEGVGEHVRTRFHVDPKAACEIAEPLSGEPHRTKKTRFFCRTVKANDPTVDLMSRRHPLSSIRTSMRR